MASLLDLAQARLGGLLAPPQRPSMVGLLGGQRPQGTLASTIAGYTPPQMQAMSNQQVMDYARTVAQTAQQNLQNQMSDLDKALVMGQQGIQVGDREALARLMEQVPGLMGATAYHGTPHTIRGKFDISKVGTGEGAQAYGHGMYFAENPAVAGQYKTALSNIEMSAKGKTLKDLGINEKVTTHSPSIFDNPLEFGLAEYNKTLRTQLLDYPELKNDPNFAKELFDQRIEFLKSWGSGTKEAKAAEAMQEFVKKNGYPDVNVSGNLYKVDIPDEYIPNMLDWDKPLLQQTPQVQEALAKLGIKSDAQKLNEFDDALLNALLNDSKAPLPKQPINPTGQDIYQTLIQGNPQYTSQRLSEVGIRGIRYLDEGSRESGKGTSNFVVFDPTDVKILEKNSQKVEGLLD